MTDRLRFQYPPEELYKKIGFESIDKMIEYGNFINKPYQGLNIHDAHKTIFGNELEGHRNRRSMFFPEPIISPPVIPNPKTTTFGFILNIGTSPESSFKVNDYVFSLTNLNLLKPTNDNTILQITPILETEVYHDQIYSNIRWCRFKNDTIRISTNTIRTTNEGWGLHVKAHLLLTIFENSILKIGG
jgi:hypothetical protein